MLRIIASKIKVCVYIIYVCVLCIVYTKYINMHEYHSEKFILHTKKTKKLFE